MLEGWKSVAVSELATFYSGGTPNKEQSSYWGGTIPWVTIKDMKAMRLNGVGESLTEKGATTVRTVPAGTILVLVRGMGLFKDLPVVLCDRPVTFNQDIKALVAKEGVDSEYLAFALIARKRDILRHVDSAGHGTGRLDTDLLKSTPLPLPPLPEQRKIAEILRTWDESIERASLVIKLRQAQYLGLRNRLINWSSDPRKSLQSLLDPVSRPVPRPTESYRALSIRSHGKGTFTRNVADPTSVDMDTLFIAREGDLIVNITFAWEGAIALIPQEHDGCLVSHRFPTFVPISRRVSARYLRHALRMPRFTYLLGLVSPGGAGRNRVLNKGDFLELEVPAPELNKQALIASALDIAETAIAKASEYRDSLTRQKRGLMQKLLTGEWRAKVEAN